MANKRKKQSFGNRRKLNLKLNRMESEENSDAAFSKTIVEINNDCLKRAFEYLDFRDLINVAEANAHLKVAAEMVFARKLNKRLIVVGINRSSVYPDISIYDDAICIRMPVLAARAIRLFGQSIPGIDLRFETNAFFREKFFVHVNEHCHKTLNILRTVGDHSNIFDKVKHPFENVEEFLSRHGRLGPGCEHFNRLFPRLRQLEFIDTEILDSTCIYETFPNLDAFSFNHLYTCEPNFIGIDFKRFTSLNPQLQSISIDRYLNPRIWEDINTELKNLKSITVCYSPEHVDRFKGPPILFNNVEKLTVYCDISSSTVSPIDMFSFKRLRNLRVRCWGTQLDGWLDFVLANPTIEVLVIDSMNCFDYLDFLEGVHQKLDKVSQNKKFMTFRTYSSSLLMEKYGKEHTIELLKFLKAQTWFNKFSIDFSRAKSYKMEDFFKKNKQMKNYYITKYALIDSPHVDFEKL